MVPHIVLFLVQLCTTLKVFLYNMFVIVRVDHLCKYLTLVQVWIYVIRKNGGEKYWTVHQKSPMLRVFRGFVPY